MRRVVVAVDADGESFVASDEEVADTGLLWAADPQNTRAWLDAIDPGRVFTPAQPPPGGATWYLSELPPRKGMELLNDPPPGMDERGLHVTKTIDFIYILGGMVVLDLDRCSVELKAGDAVVLQAANHAWRNPTDEPVRFLDLLVSGE